MTVYSFILIYLSVGMVLAAFMLINRDFVVGMTMGLEEASPGARKFVWIFIIAVCILLWPLVLFTYLRGTF